MATINADMTDAQDWIPLTAANAGTLASGSYKIGTEQIEVLDQVKRIGAEKATPTTLKGRKVRRAVGGSTAAAHSSGATLVRYYPEAIPTLTEVIAAGSDTTGALFSTNAGVPGSTFVTPIRLDSTNKLLYVWNGTSYTKVADYA